MRYIQVATIIFAFLLIHPLLVAQEKWAVEFRPGLNIPTSDFMEVTLKIGFGFEGVVSYNFMEHLGVYVGWGWNQFKTDDVFIGSGADIEERGYTFGLHYIHPITPSTRLSCFISVGGIYNHIDIENSEGNSTTDSGYGFGWELSAGISYGIGDNFYIRPQIGYRSLTRDITFGGNTEDVTLNYMVIGMGISKTF